MSRACICDGKTVVIDGEMELTAQMDGEMDLTAQMDGECGILLAIHDGGDIPPFTGLYEVSPSFEEQTLATRNKRMLNDVVVHEIAVERTSNLSGGLTVYIGSTL